MSKTYDVVVVGGGHNGLVCAAYLAKAGRSVLVLERRHVLGGAAATEEIYPGFKYTICSYVVSLLRPQIINDLDLPRFGFELLPLDGTLSPMPDGDCLMRWTDQEDARDELLRYSANDADAYEPFTNTMYHMARAVRPMLSTIPPDPTSLSPKSLAALAAIGKEFGCHGAHLYDLAKIMTMSVSDWVGQWFESEPLKATVMASGLIGTMLGPRSPGTAYVMLHHYMGDVDGVFRAWGFPRGGMGGVSNAIADAARSHGAEIRTESPIQEVMVRNGRAIGVALDSGEEVAAKAVVSSLDPRRTFEVLLAPEHLDADFLAQVRRYNIRGSSGKVNLALDELPRLDCLRAAQNRSGLPAEAYMRGVVAISPDTDYLERAYDDCKYGRFSRKPFLDIVIPSIVDPSMAPPGKHVMSIFVTYAPYELENTSWPEQREAFGDNVIQTLAEYIPNLEEIILHRQVLTPWDLEQEIGLTQGNIFHGELSLEQLFFLRPVPGWSEYRTPIRNLYLCGSGTHPGGGVMGSPGQLAAGRILADST